MALGMTVSELGHRMSSRELTEWMAFYSLEPFGYVANLHGDAITASVVAEVNRNNKEKSDPFQPQDFVPQEPLEEQEQEEQKSVFQKLKEHFFATSNPTQSKT